MKSGFPEKDFQLRMVLEWTAEGKPLWRKLTDKEQQHKRAHQWAVIREERDRLLRQSDVTQLLDSPYDKECWAAYRHKLRTLPQTQGNPFAIQWPKEPNASVPERARNALGQFVSDDPATPDENQAWS